MYVNSQTYVRHLRDSHVRLVVYTLHSSYHTPYSNLCHTQQSASCDSATHEPYQAQAFRHQPAAATAWIVIKCTIHHRILNIPHMYS